MGSACRHDRGARGGGEPTVRKVRCRLRRRGGANGFLNSVYLNFGLAAGQAAPSTLTAPVTITINAGGLLSPTSDERGFTAGSSDGSITRSAYNKATKATQLTWVIPAGFDVPTIGTNDALPDVLSSFQDGLTSGGRLANKIVVTSVTGENVTSPSASPIDSSVVKDYNKSAVSPDGIY